MKDSKVANEHKVSTRDVTFCSKAVVIEADDLDNQVLAQAHVDSISFLPSEVNDVEVKFIIGCSLFKRLFEQGVSFEEIENKMKIFMIVQLEDDIIHEMVKVGVENKPEGIALVADKNNPKIPFGIPKIVDKSKKDDSE